MNKQNDDTIIKLTPYVMGMPPKIGEDLRGKEIGGFDKAERLQAMATHPGSIAVEHQIQVEGGDTTAQAVEVHTDVA